MSKIELEYLGDLQTHCTHEDSGAEITVDAPKEVGGAGAYFAPTDLLAASLGACMLTLMGLAAKRFGVDVKGTKVSVRKEMRTSPPGRVKTIWISIYCPKEFNEEVTKNLITAMKTCPVHQSLHPDVEQKIEYFWGRSQ